MFYGRAIRLSVGRFQVMALLQAARANVLGLPLDLAFSWGLNRAIFYAAAKRGFRRGVKPIAPRTHEVIRRKPVEETPEVYHLGDEMAYKKEVSGETYFTIGGETQTLQDFRRQIEDRFGSTFEKVWEEAVRLIKEFDEETLLSQRLFYERVYKPRRDELAKKWALMVRER